MLAPKSKFGDRVFGQDQQKPPIHLTLAILIPKCPDQQKFTGRGRAGICHFTWSNLCFLGLTNRGWVRGCVQGVGLGGGGGGGEGGGGKSGMMGDGAEGVKE